MAWKWRRGRAKPPLRYFVYISDAKLEMLFDQIPPQLRRRLSAEAKVDLKLASLSMKASEQPAPTRMAKLKVVERYIDCNHQVGTIHSPGTQYFRGTAPIRWGWLMEDGTDRVVFFYGKRDDGHVVFLVGSRHHVLGAEPLPGNAVGSERSAEYASCSATPSIIKALFNHLSQLHESATMPDESDDEFPDEKNISTLECALADGESLEGPAQWMEFLAVPVIAEQLPRDSWWPAPIFAVLATPIYVAHADPE